MSIKTNKVSNCLAYLDGASLLGRAEEITLPEINYKMADHKGLGLVGESELPVGISKMSMKIKWNAVYPEVMKKTHDPYTPIRFQIRANVESYENLSRIGQTALVAFVTAVPKKAGGLVFKPQDNVEREDEFNVTAYKLEIGGEEICDVDVLNNIWVSNGKDMLSQYRANLGL